MSAQHTPGPWAYHSGTHGIFSNSALAEGRAICTVHGPRGVESAARTANAALIKAAPDLLEALQSVVRQIEPLLDKQGFAYVGAIQKARAAIAAATGAQP